MANKPIQTSDIIQDKVLEKTIKEFEAWGVVVKKVESDLLDLAKVTKKGLFDIDTKKVESVKKLSSEIAELEAKTKLLNTSRQNQKKTLSEVEKLQLKLSKIRKGELDETIKLRAEISKETKQRKENSVSILKTTLAYKKLTIATNKAQLEFKELAVQFGVNSKQAESALQRYNRLDDALRKVNNTARDGRRDVGRYGIATKGLGVNLASIGSSLVGGLGIVAGVQLFTRVLKDSFDIIRNFSKAQSDLASILGTTASEITDLTELFKELGSTTVFSATEVTKAGEELAKLGFNAEQIKGSLQGVLDTAVALGTDIPRASTLVAGTLNAFNLSAKESSRVASVLGVASTKSALDIAKLETSLSNVGTTANAFGLSIEETTAVLGLLADKNIDASTAGSQFRNILLLSSKEGLNYREALDVIANSTDKAGTALKLFGKQGVSVALALADQKDVIDSTTEAITNQDEALEKLVNERLNNLDGDLKILSSTWEGLILSFEDGDGVLNDVLRGAVKFATELVNIFIKFNEIVGKAFRIIGQFFDRLAVEFKPLIDGIKELFNGVKELFNGFGDFNIVGLITEAIISRLVIATKLLVLPFRLLFQQVLLLKDAFIIVSNEGKKLLNLLGADFKIEPVIDIVSLQSRFDKIKDIVIDTFTVDKLEVPTIDQQQVEKAGEDFTKAFNKGISKGGVGAKEEEAITGAIEKQRIVVSKLQKEKEKANEEDIASINIRLGIASEELKRLEELGIALKKVKEIEDTRAKDANARVKQLLLDRKADEIEIQGDSLKATLKNIDNKESAEIDAINNRYERELEAEGLLAEQIAEIQLKQQLEVEDTKNKFDKLRDRENEKEVKKFKDLQKTLTDALQDALDARYDKIQANLDRELEASKTQQQRLQELADKGSKDALESLQAEREKEQAIEKEKLRQQRQQANIQKGIEVFKVLGQNDGNVTKTIADVTLLEAFIKTLPTAFDGTEDTGKGGKGIDNKGGFLSVLHPNERVVPKVINDKLKGISNVELGTMADVYNTLHPKLKEIKSDKTVVNFDRLEKAINELPKNMPMQNLIFDEQEKAYINIIKRNGKTERKHARSNGLFR